MRHKGRVSLWHDEKGYGFVTPCLPGPNVFLHIKAFGQIQKRPQVGDLLTYALSQDDRSRSRAAQAAYSLEKFVPERHRPIGTRRRWAVPFAIASLFGITVSAFFGALPVEIIGLYWLASALALVLYGWDKTSATRAVQRTPENTLLIVGLFGGWPGALLAQEFFRHKTAKASFQILFWISVIANAGLLAWYLIDPNIMLSTM